MKKSFIAAVFTIGLIGNAFASCDTTPYNAPEELRPVCGEEASVVSDVLTTSADQVKVKVEIDSETERRSGASGKRAAKETESKK